MAHNDIACDEQGPRAVRNLAILPDPIEGTGDILEMWMPEIKLRGKYLVTRNELFQIKLDVCSSRIHLATRLGQSRKHIHMNICSGTCSLEASSACSFEASSIFSFETSTAERMTASVAALKWASTLQ
jgi:hypothetical protein